MTASRLFFSEDHPQRPRGYGPASRVAKAEPSESILNSEHFQAEENPDPEQDFIQFTREEYVEELLKSRDDERERVGHELHDSAGQLLLYLQLSVARLKSLEAADEHDELIEEIQATAKQIAAEIRSLAFLNHPVRVSSDGIEWALRSLVEGFGKRTGFNVEFKSIGNSDAADDACSLALLRVAQEALVNVHRHARASSVAMRLICRDEWLELTIRDDGIGMPSAQIMAARGGVGVNGMQFRVEQLGGTFKLVSGKRGTRIIVRVPLTDPNKVQAKSGLNQLISNGVPHQIGGRP